MHVNASHHRRAWIGVLSAWLGLILSASTAAANTVVRFAGSQGNVDVELYDDATPKTVANFLNYVTSGSYNNTIIHRSARSNGNPFVIQGGGYGTNGKAIVANPPVVNEAYLLNLRGTISLSQPTNGTNGATSQWFVNLGNNTDLDSYNPDPSALNGPFTVFGRVLDPGMTVVDSIAALPRFAFALPFDELPLINYAQADFPNKPQLSNLVVVNSAAVFGHLQPAWQDATLRFDVTHDGTVAPIDVLVIINDLSLNGQHPLMGPFTGPFSFDVNGDDYLSVQDGQQVFDRLNTVGITHLSVQFAPEAFAASPVPEPSTIWLLATAAVAGVSWSALRWLRRHRADFTATP